MEGVGEAQQEVDHQQEIDGELGLRVLEAAGRVKLTPIEDFFGKNIGKAERLTRRVSDRERKVDYKQYLDQPVVTPADLYRALAVIS